MEAGDEHEDGHEDVMKMVPSMMHGDGLMMPASEINQIREEEGRRQRASPQAPSEGSGSESRGRDATDIAIRDHGYGSMCLGSDRIFGWLIGVVDTHV